MVLRRLSAAVIVLVLVATAIAEPRHWTDSTGKFHSEAELADYQNGHAYLKEANGRIVSVPASRLSATDCDFIKSTVPAVQSIRGKVVGITDGDTLTVLDTDEKQHKVRLEGIDAPESHQAYGTLARKALSAKTFQKDVVVETHGQDKYGRTLGHIFADGHWINRELVQEGWAWHYREYSKSEVLADAESEARTSHAGLWKDANPTAPWDFRHLPTVASTAKHNGEESPKELATKNDNAKQIVYVTKTGAKYHQDGCRSLSKSRIPMSLDEAANRYSPCSICHPPIPSKAAKASSNGASEQSFASLGDNPKESSTSSYQSVDRNPNNETVTGHTATGIPTYTGPRGGHYHYSKSGKKVYERKK
jgi:micrococcal nuclease